MMDGEALQNTIKKEISKHPSQPPLGISHFSFAEKKETLKMTLWLVGLGLALLCTVNAESECTKDHSQAQGKWYVTAFASDCDEFLKHKDMMKIVAAHVTFKEDNKLLITTSFPKKDGCKKMELEFVKLDDGTYVHTSEWGSTKKMEVVSTDCKTHAIVRAQIERKGKTSNHLALYSRTPERPVELEEKFSETGRNSGFRDNQIIFPDGVACENEE